MVDKKKGDGDGKDNVIPFPTKQTISDTDPKAIAIIVREVMDDLVGQLSPEQRKDFEEFLQQEKPDLADKLLHKFPNTDEDMELVGSWNMDQIEDKIVKCESHLDLCFEYIKNIEKAMFGMSQSLMHEEMHELREDLQKLWLKVQKKVDFE
jgi:hypothetical protein